MKKVLSLFFALMLLFSHVPVSANPAQEDAMNAFQRLNSALDGKPDTYLGCWLGDDNSLHVGLTTDDPDVIAEYEAMLEGSDAEIVFEVRPYSWNQLDALNTAISERLAVDENPYNLSSWGIYLDKCCVFVNSSVENNDELLEQLYLLCDELGLGHDAIEFEGGISIAAHTEQSAPATFDAAPFLTLVVVVIPLIAAALLLTKRFRRI